MLVSSYKEFVVAEKVRVKKEVIYEFLLSNFNSPISSSRLPVVDYVVHQTNLLTIAEIEYNPKLILETNFSFTECDGSLFYGQFTKCFPSFYIFEPNDFKG